MSSPARAYYEACEGRWQTTLSVSVTDADALARGGMSWPDRVLLHLLARWPRWLGAVRMHTAVELTADPRVVHHHTQVLWLGLPIKRSLEIFTLEPDGHRLTVSGDMTGSASVDPTSTHATYTLRWLGVTLHQTSTRAPDRVELVQEGPGFRATQTLCRRA